MMPAYQSILKQCEQHAYRLQWAKNALSDEFPLTMSSLSKLGDADQAILDQLSLRFSKLQDAMGANLFPLVLEISKEQGELKAFIDQLNRLEKINAIPSAEKWLILREMRNQFSHDYPNDPEIQAVLLNKAYVLIDDLLSTLTHITLFANKYLTKSIDSATNDLPPLV
ncbi:MAG: hypothetical protein HOP04_04010 [Methylophilaceae bacterium]|nr:hypothetical protein [Methylophilaceae bacterium]